MFTLTVVGLVCCFASFAVGVFAGKQTKKKLIHGTIPVASIVNDFEEFARLEEGGKLSVEADAAIKVLKAHVEQKKLPAKKEKPLTFDKDYRKNEWSDGRCFEREMQKANTDDERIVIVRNWMKKYTFTQAWQTWCIDSLKAPDGRNYMRNMFSENNED